jgi:hypothetical protein
MKNKIRIPLKLIDGRGYDSKELYNLFKKQGRGKKWEEYINGSTGAISKDGKHLLVYPWDVENFVEGLPNYD